MARVGRDTVLKQGANVIAGVRVLNFEWKSETVDISQGESDGYRRSCEIDGLKTIDISVEGITKDNYFQEIAYSRSQSRLLTDVTIEIPDATGTGFQTLTSDFYLANLNITGEYNGAISFLCSLIGSAIIENGEIIGITRDSGTGQITGRVGYTYSAISCVSTNIDDTYWSAGANTVWSGSEWSINSGSDMTLNAINAWRIGYRPSKLTITLVSTIPSDDILFTLAGTTGQIIFIEPINVTDSPQSFEFDLDFTGNGDIDGITINSISSQSVSLNCIQFT